MSAYANYENWKDEESGKVVEVWRDLADKDDNVFVGLKGVNFTAMSEGSLEIEIPKSTARKLGLIPNLEE